MNFNPVAPANPVTLFFFFSWRTFLPALDVLTGARVDLEQVAFLDKSRRLERGPRLQCDGLLHVGGRVAAHRSVGLHHLERDKGGNFDIEHLAVVLLQDNGGVLDVEVPTFVTLKVVQADAAVRGDTATNVQKTVTLETGATLKAPAFIKEGDLLKIDTRSGEYVERG